MADALLVLSNVAVIAIGSYTFFKCLQKRAKTATKLAKHLGAPKSHSGLSANAKVHPL